jgi:outer membrane protein, heavy metal efflux system
MWIWSSIRAHSRSAGYRDDNFSSSTRQALRLTLVALACAGAAAAHAADAVYSAGTVPGATVESLLQYAREHNPEYAAMKLEATAADERVYPAGALPDPRFRNEFRDITRMEAQNPTLLPSRVGSNRYLLMQDIPWAGKRDLKREIAQHDAEGAQGRALGTWSDVAARIKTAYAQLFYVRGTLGLTREILDLMTRLEKVAQVRYAGGLAAQQDVIRAQVEQTNMRNELVAMESEQHHLEVQLNGLLARPAHAPLAPPQRLRPVPRLDYAALEARVRERNPQLYADEARVRSAEKSRELAYKNRYPDFTLGVAPIQYQNSVREWEVMVELNIPLQQKTRRSQERESEAMLAAARARKEATANQVLADLAQSLSAVEAAQRTETLVDKSLLPQSDLTLQSALAAYQNGKVDFATLLDAQRAIRQAKQSRLKAQVDAQTRLAEIEKLLGEEL